MNDAVFRRNTIDITLHITFALFTSLQKVLVCKNRFGKPGISIRRNPPDSSWLELYGSLSTMHIRKKSFFSTHLPLLLFLQLLDFICIDMLFMIECTSLLEEYFLPRRHVFFGSFYIIVKYLSKVLVSTRAMSGSFEGSL